MLCEGPQCYCIWGAIRHMPHSTCTRPCLSVVARVSKVIKHNQLVLLHFTISLNLHEAFNFCRFYETLADLETGQSFGKTNKFNAARKDPPHKKKPALQMMESTVLQTDTTPVRKQTGCFSTVAGLLTLTPSKFSAKENNSNCQQLPVQYLFNTVCPFIHLFPLHGQVHKGAKE